MVEKERIEKERIMTVNLRKKFIKKPKWRRANIAVRTVEDFVKRHMKTDTVKLSKEVGEKIWSRSREKPPNKIRIKAIKKEDGTVEVKLLDTVEETLEEVKTKIEEEKKENESKKETSGKA